MKMHPNGWEVFELYLKLRGLRQNALADFLAVSPSAVSQIKKGNLLLRGPQLSRLIDILDIEPADQAWLYTSIFNARMLSGEAATRFVVSPVSRQMANDRENGIPLLSLYEFRRFQPLLEDIADCAASGSFPSGNSDVTLAVQADLPIGGAPVPPSSVLLLATDRHPHYGELVLAHIGDGEIVAGYFRRLGDWISIVPDLQLSGRMIHLGAEPQLHWIYPIREIVISGVADRKSP